MPLGKKFHVPVIADNTASGNMTPVSTVRGAGPAASPSPGGEGRGEGELSNRKSEEGIALVITLILLSVTLVMAVAFLAISRRERGSVSTNTDTVMAKNAVQSAFAAAQAQIVSRIETTTNPYISSLIVSTNFINSIGFTNTGGPGNLANLGNVNFDHYANVATPLSAADFIQNCANLFYSPRVPVFYSNDFRFYLDLNRNGRYDTNGVVTNFDNNLNGLGFNAAQTGDPEWIGVLEHPDQPHGPNNPFVARYCFIAVPADSLDLNHIHNQALDAASGSPAINQAPATSDAYFRNQGVATWEINLAAFLTDLNTNRWDPLTIWNPLLEPYQYPEGLFGRSAAFDDARALVAWRYNNSYLSLASADSLFGGVGSLGDLAFRNSGVDLYSAGPLQTSFNTNYTGLIVQPNRSWLGADNTNSFFSTPSDLFDPNKSSIQFTNNLVSAGVSNATYDRYTFYRMLSQLGIESSPESDKININYSNVLVNYDAGGVPTSFTVVPGAETNFVSWAPNNFFLAAADKMLRAYTTEWYESSPSNYMQTYYGLTEPYFTNIDGVGITNIQYFGQTNQIPSFGITNIPVCLDGQFVYTPAVNRILQLAANIFDATTNVQDLTSGNSNYPSVFRPILWKTNEFNYTLNAPVTNIYIRTFQYAQDRTPLSPPIFYLPTEVNDYSVPFGLTGFTNNFYGVPWIVGAKKGFPNFNGSELQDCFFVERLLQFNRNTTASTGRTYTTNQMYIMGLSNVFAIEDWNSYATNYNNQVQIIAQDTLSMGLSNDAAFYVTVTNSSFIIGTPPPFSFWPARSFSSSFVFPIGTGTNTIMQSLATPNLNLPAIVTNLFIYYYGPGSETVDGVTFKSPCFIPTYMAPSNYLDQGTPPLPHLVLQTTNRLQAYILDTHDRNNTYILDYIQLGGMNSSMDINQAIADNSRNSFTYPNNNQGLWSTNYYQGSVPYGINAQYLVSRGDDPVTTVDGDGGFWTTTPVPGTTDTTPPAQQAFFKAFFSDDNRTVYAGAKLGYVENDQTNVQAPFTPTRQVVQRFVYEANDPLVHYLASDLYDFPDNTNTIVNTGSPVPQLQRLGHVSNRYMPWGTLGNLPSTTFTTPSGGTTTPDNNAFNISYKDPLVWESDNWDFPTNKFSNVGMLGRVHRGTPWQTVYLKATNVLNLATVTGSGSGARVTGNGFDTWMPWTGDIFNQFDAVNLAPVQDRLLFDLFTTTFAPNATRGQLSVNIGADDPNNPLAGLAAWSALLSGTIAFSNNANDFALGVPGAEGPIKGQVIPGYAIWTNEPIGAPPYPGNSVSPQGSITNVPLWKIVTGINNARTNFVGIDGLRGVFEHVGDVLSAPQLAELSPYLNPADVTQQQRDISDEMYEWMPQQVMSLLTVSSTPRYVVYCYGQTLKPAPNGLVSSGQFFGMCTNYQVTAETASRVVIRVDNTPTPANPTATPHVVVEQFNPLPPD